MAEDEGFLSRWSQRKVQTRRGIPLPETPVPAAAVAVPPPSAASVVQAPPPANTEDRQPTPAEPPLPTLDDVAALGRDSDFARFVRPGVAGDVRNAALKKLFSDPHFNVMDGLDIYIDDYGKPDPLPASMLRQMAQSAFLGLVEPDPPATPPHEETVDHVAAATTPAARPEAAETTAHDENPDLRLQSLDGTGPPGPDPGAGQDAGRQC